MDSSLSVIVDTERYPLTDDVYRLRAHAKLASDGVLVMEGFLRPAAVEMVRQEGEEHRGKAYFCVQEHNVYLTPADPDYDRNHPRNRQVSSSKGCITDDIVPADSPLRTLYDDSGFREFLCAVFDEKALHNYADPLSSINIHYADDGQELGWHFDNSSFAITLLIQSPHAGGEFEYVSDVRNAERGEMNFDRVSAVLDGKVTPEKLDMPAGTLVLFRGRNALHRVVPVSGKRTRMLVVLAYNAEPGISLSESARMTFYGRLT